MRELHVSPAARDDVLVATLLDTLDQLVVALDAALRLHDNRSAAVVLGSVRAICDLVDRRAALVDQDNTSSSPAKNAEICTSKHRAS